MKNIFIKRKVLIIVIIVLVLLLLIILLKIEHKPDISIEEQIKNTRVVSEHTKEEIGNDTNYIYNNYETVRFGNYYQQENSDNKNEIEWFVLDKKDGYALLLSKYILDVSKMSDEDEECQWSESILRNWLNNKFYALAFNDIEKSKIIECELVNFNIPSSLHKKQDITKDKVFILSLEELQKFFYDNERLVNEELTTTATNYAFSKNKLINFNSKDALTEKEQFAETFNVPVSSLNINTTTYWTRTYKDDKCLIINYNGYILGKNEKKSNLNKYNGVRPAIFINVSNIATNSVITYDKFLGYNSNDFNIEYDLSKTPIKQKLYKKNERRAYFKQLIDKKLYPEKLKNFIDVDQLDNISGKTVDELLQKIKELAYKNVISELLRENVDFDKLPITENYINNHPNLLGELKKLSSKYEVKSNGIVNTKYGEHYTVSVYNISSKSGYHSGGYGIIVFFDNVGNIDEIDIIELRH